MQEWDNGCLKILFILLLQKLATENFQMVLTEKIFGQNKSDDLWYNIKFSSMVRWE